MTRAPVLEAFRASLGEELAALERVIALARDEATHPESRPENKYDTRALEASYLAAGQGQRLGELRELVAWLAREHPPADRARLGALLEVWVDGRTRWVLLAPRGGASVRVDSVEVTLVSVASPLGKALVGLREDDTTTLAGPKGPTPVEVFSVS